MSSAVEDLQEGVGEAQWQALSAGLSEHMLDMLANVYGEMPDDVVRAALVREVIGLIPEHGDLALLAASSRVAWALDAPSAADGESAS